MDETRLAALGRMLAQGMHRRRLLGVFAGLVGLSFGKAGATRRTRGRSTGKAHAAAAGGCHHYEGTFTAVAPPTCDGILCTHGTLVGDLLAVAIGTALWALFAFWLHAKWIGVAPFG